MGNEAILREWAALRKGIREEVDSLIATYSSSAATNVRTNASNAIRSTLEQVLKEETLTPVRLSRDTSSVCLSFDSVDRF